MKFVLNKEQITFFPFLVHPNTMVYVTNICAGAMYHLFSLLQVLMLPNMYFFSVHILPEINPLLVLTAMKSETRKHNLEYWKRKRVFYKDSQNIAIVSLHFKGRQL